MSLEMVKAIYSLRPGSEFSLDNGDYSTIKWDVLEGKAPTEAEINAEIAKIKANEEAEKTTKVVARAALLERLGLTEAEANLLLS